MYYYKTSVHWPICGCCSRCSDSTDMKPIACIILLLTSVLLSLLTGSCQGHWVGPAWGYDDDQDYLFEDQKRHPNPVFFPPTQRKCYMSHDRYIAPLRVVLSRRRPIELDLEIFINILYYSYLIHNLALWYCFGAPSQYIYENSTRHGSLKTKQIDVQRIILILVCTYFIGSSELRRHAIESGVW